MRKHGKHVRRLTPRAEIYAAYRRLSFSLLFIMIAMTYTVIVFDDHTDFFQGSKAFDTQDEAFAFARAEKTRFPDMTVRVHDPSDDEILII